MTLVEWLNKGRARIEAGWAQGAMALLPDGSQCHSTDPAAASFCLLGSVQDAPVEAARALGRVTFARHAEPSLVLFNDAPGRTKEDVLEIFDEAIKAAT